MYSSFKDHRHRHHQWLKLSISKNVTSRRKSHRPTPTTTRRNKIESSFILSIHKHIQAQAQLWKGENSF